MTHARVSGKLSKRRFWYKSYTLYPIVFSTSGRNLQGCQQYPHQQRFLALLGMTMGGYSKIFISKKPSKALYDKRLKVSAQVLNKKSRKNPALFITADLGNSKTVILLSCRDQNFVTICNYCF
jgi:hypothetical protein